MKSAFNRSCLALLVETQRRFDCGEVKNAFPTCGKNVVIKFPIDKSVNHFSYFLDVAIASLQESMSGRWLVGLLVGRPLAGWSVGPSDMPATIAVSKHQCQAGREW